MGGRKGLLRVMSTAFVLILITCVFTGCANSGGGIYSLDDLKKPKAKIGVAYDLVEYDMLKRDYPDAEIITYNDNQLAYEDVSNGRLDAHVYSRIDMEFAISNGVKGVHLLDDNYSSHTIAVGIAASSKIPDFENRLNAFIAALREDGTLDDMYRRWVTIKDEKMPEIKKPENPTLKLRVGTTGGVTPFSYYKGTELTGYDIELAYRFAAYLNAEVEFRVYDFNGVIAAAETSEVDCIMSNLFVTEERREELHFSDPLFEVQMAVMVKDSGAITSLSQLKNGNIAVMTGTNFPEHVLQCLPDADILYFNTSADCVNAVKNGKADAAAYDEPSARYLMTEDSTVTFLPEFLEKVDYGYIFQMSDEGEALRDKVSAYIIKLKEDGTLKALQEKWCDAEDITAVELPNYLELPETNGKVTAATIEGPPFSFMAEGLMGGYEVEILYLFCRDNGYALEITEVNMDAIISAVQSGKFDTAFCGISITEERKESMLFSEPDYSGGTVLVVKKSEEAQNKNFFVSIGESFRKTFIRENRWKMFLQGIGTTVLITVISVILGTALGFFVFMRCRKGNRAANAITRFCIWLIHGMPVVVLLMILYYIVFGKVDISGTVVSIIGFTLIFASAVFNMLKSGVGAVDSGQTEAAYALGFSDRRTFYRVILPQALPHFMPAYKGEITSLIKATAVVGYVTVQDLTKMGDIVRSRTYEAFFPLIAVAVIYFILAAILTFIVNKIELRVDPRRRLPEKILKGVNDK